MAEAETRTDAEPRGTQTTQIVHRVSSILDVDELSLHSSFVEGLGIQVCFLFSFRCVFFCFLFVVCFFVFLPLCVFRFLADVFFSFRCVVFLSFRFFCFLSVVCLTSFCVELAGHPVETQGRGSREGSVAAEWTGFWDGRNSKSIVHPLYR